MSDQEQAHETRAKHGLRIVSDVRHVENDVPPEEEPFYQDLAEEKIALLKESYAIYQRENGIK